MTADKATEIKLLTVVVSLRGDMDELNARKCFQLRVITASAALNGGKKDLTCQSVNQQVAAARLLAVSIITSWESFSPCFSSGNAQVL